ncbi:MAG: copper amine oxidase N-terminal domain-containing protein [Defluviitaleaceae bacterium]|nr:copper amine oxidase N-terminal domain-containing protein [Defluviitaleaceae bacterium]
MKRFLSFILVLIMVVGNAGMVFASTFAFERWFDDINRFEEKYNISYFQVRHADSEIFSPLKVHSVTELIHHFADWQEIIIKYCESFFHDRFLVFVNIIESDTDPLLRVTSVLYENDMINIEITRLSRVLNAPIETEWIIILEMPNELADKEVNVEIVREKIFASDIVDFDNRNKFEEKYNISYFEVFRGVWLTPPFKARSVTELISHLADCEKISLEYDENFFNDKFLVFVNVYEIDTVLRSRVTSVLYENDLINIELTRLPLSQGDPTMTEWIIILEMPNEVADKRILITERFCDALQPVPPSPPTVFGTPTTNSIILNELPGVQFRIATPILGNWQTSPVFTGLTPDTEYTFQTRVVPVGFISPSEASLPSDIIRTALSPTPTITFIPENVSINNGNLSQTVNVTGTALGEISVSYNHAQVPSGVTVAYNATDAIITITGVRPTTNIPAVTGEFDVSVTREGVVESFTVSVNLTTTYVSSGNNTSNGNDGGTGGGTPGGSGMGGSRVGGGIIRPMQQQPTREVNPETTAQSETPPQNESAPSEISVTITVDDETTAEISLVDFNLDGINPHRIIAIAGDGTITGGTLDAETGLFTFEAQKPGEFTITYVANLIRLSLQPDSPVITDLANNTPTQVMDVLPIIQDGRTLVPIRFIAESLGSSINWNSDTREVTLTQHGIALTFAIGQAARGMDVPAQIMNGRTMVSLHFISEFFKAQINRCEETYNIEIIKL